MVALENPQVALPLAGAAALLLAAAVVLWRGGRRGAPLWLALFLGGRGAVWLLGASQLLSAPPFGPFDATRTGVLALTGTGVAALAGLGLLWFLLDFPAPLSRAQHRSFFLAAGLVVAILTASAMLMVTSTYASANGAPRLGETALLGGYLLLDALATGPLLLATLALPLRYFDAQVRRWDRAALAWFGAMLSLSPALSYGMSFLILARFATAPGELITIGLDVAVLGVAAALWLRATTAGPRDATRTARNLALLVVGLVAAGFVVGRVAVAVPASNITTLAYVGAQVALAAMAIDAVLRQRLLEGLDEPPARQVEAPPPA